MSRVALRSVLTALITVLPIEVDMARVITDDALAIVTIAQEAIGEPYEGKVAVAEVIRNRMERKYSSDGTVAGTVLRALQFSGWNADATGRIRSLKIDDTDPKVADCARAWQAAKEGSQTVKGAVLYYAPAIVRTPAWARPAFAEQVAEIGGHVFFVPKLSKEV